MTDQFSIDISSWLPGREGQEEIQNTIGLLQIAVGGRLMTRAEDTWSKSVQQFAVVSAYPLAEWLAASWWRLRWESRPFRSSPDRSWRMAHEMPAAGYGFLWPSITFESDGEEIRVICQPSSSTVEQPLRYLAEFSETIRASTFERVVDQFIDLVLARLEAVGAKKAGLQNLWSEIRQERGNPEVARGRKMEARLGFEPDEAPEHLLERLDSLSTRAGLAAVEELAPVCAGSQPEVLLTQIEEFAEQAGRDAELSLPSLPMAEHLPAVPWERGWNLAGRIRQSCGVETPTISDEKLASLLGMPPQAFASPAFQTMHPPLGLAIRENGNSRLKVLFRKRNRPALRFEAARFLVEHILAPTQDRWLPVTDSTTARQKVQRAFAAEFLSPIDDLKEFLKGDFSPEAIEEAAENFGVSELTVKSHLANHGQMPFDAVSV